jgi:geranylgeranyl pyrophosphate synthase
MQDIQISRTYCNEAIFNFGQLERVSADIDSLPIAKNLRTTLKQTSLYSCAPTRSTLLLLACQAVDGIITDAERMAGQAIEMFALFLHVHDDIIDKTDATSSLHLPSIRAQHGDNVALVIGDLLLLRSTMLLSRALLSRLSEDETRQGLDIFEKAALDIANTQLRELELLGNLNVTPDTYLSIARTKIAEFEVCMNIGALMGRGRKEEIVSLSRYGHCIGMIILLRSDLLDIWFRRDILISRLHNELVPLPVLIAVSRSDHARHLLESLKNSTNIDDDKWLTLLSLLSETKAIDDTMQLITELGTSAKSALCMSRNPAKISLEAFIDVLCNDFRNYSA